MSEITWTNDTRKLSDLVPWEHNPKRMTKKQAEGLRLSIERFGFAVPFLVSPDGDIYDGHQRQALMGAIKEHGPNATVDVRVSSRPLTDDERRELVVRLKQNQAGWDFDMLPNLYEREELLEWGFEPEELGMFPDDEKPDDPGAQVDKAEELRVKWGVEPGQLWQLGEHRLICGDCTDAAVVERVMGGERAGMVFTDPPYGMNLDTDYTKMPNDLVKSRKYSSVIGDDKSFDFASFQWLECKEQFWWGADYYCQSLPPGGSWFVWDKRVESNDASIGSGFELCWSKTPHKRRLLRYNWSGYTAHDPNETRSHPTQKPLALFTELLSEYAGYSQIVFDPFLGSGTTLIACERLGRRCRAVEIAPGYVAVALQRFYDMTGIEPVLLEPGNSDLTVISNG